VIVGDGHDGQIGADAGTLRTDAYSTIRPPSVRLAGADIGLILWIFRHPCRPSLPLWTSRWASLRHGPQLEPFEGAVAGAIGLVGAAGGVGLVGAAGAAGACVESGVLGATD